MSKIESKTLKDHSEVIGFMDIYKPMVHLRKNDNEFKLKALIRIPKGMNYSVNPNVIQKPENMERTIVVNVDRDDTKTEDYIISVKATLKSRGYKKIPVIGVRVYGPGAPEEGSTMVGEDDGDERP